MKETGKPEAQVLSLLDRQHALKFERATPPKSALAGKRVVSDKPVAIGDAFAKRYLGELADNKELIRELKAARKFIGITLPVLGIQHLTLGLPEEITTTMRHQASTFLVEQDRFERVTLADHIAFESAEPRTKVVNRERTRAEHYRQIELDFREGKRSMMKMADEHEMGKKFPKLRIYCLDILGNKGLINRLVKIREALKEGPKGMKKVAIYLRDNDPDNYPQQVYNFFRFFDEIEGTAFHAMIDICGSQTSDGRLTKEFSGEELRDLIERMTTHLDLQRAYRLLPEFPMRRSDEYRTVAEVNSSELLGKDGVRFVGKMNIKDYLKMLHYRWTKGES